MEFQKELNSPEFLETLIDNFLWEFEDEKPSPANKEFNQFCKQRLFQLRNISPRKYNRKIKNKGRK